MSDEQFVKQLTEASELLEIVECYMGSEGLDEVAQNGVRVLLRETRSRVNGVVSGLNRASNGSVVRSSRSSSKSLAARIQRLPEGEFRSVELDLDADYDESIG